MHQAQRRYLHVIWSGAQWVVCWGALVPARVAKDTSCCYVYEGYVEFADALVRRDAARPPSI